MQLSLPETQYVAEDNTGHPVSTFGYGVYGKNNKKKISGSIQFGLLIEYCLPLL